MKSTWRERREEREAGRPLMEREQREARWDAQLVNARTQPHKCPICGKIRPTWSAVNDHMNGAHGRSGTGPDALEIPRA